MMGFRVSGFVRVCLGLAVCIAAWGAALPAVADDGTPQPGPERTKMEMMVGDWSYEGAIFESPLGPKGKFAGKSSIASILGGFFVEDTWDEGANGSGLQIFGYDEMSKRHFVNAYSSDGGRHVGTVEIAGDVIVSTWTRPVSGAAMEAMVKGVWTYAPDRSSFTAAWQFSLDKGRTWTPWIEYKGKKRQ